MKIFCLKQRLAVLDPFRKMNTIIRLANFLRAKSAKQHRELKTFLEEHEAEFHDVPLHTAVRWLSKGKVLSRVWGIKQHIWSICMDLVHFEVLAVFGPYFFTKMSY